MDSLPVKLISLDLNLTCTISPLNPLAKVYAYVSSLFNFLFPLPWCESFSFCFCLANMFHHHLLTTELYRTIVRWRMYHNTFVMNSLVGEGLSADAVSNAVSDLDRETSLVMRYGEKRKNRKFEKTIWHASLEKLMLRLNPKSKGDC